MMDKDLDKRTTSDNESQKLNSETKMAIENVEKGIGLSKGYTDLDEMWSDIEKEE